MIKIRLRFSKSGPLRYIGHLNFLKVFQQTIRRAGLPGAFSQGFNPHMQLSFALPLPLGMTSYNDYADIILESEMPMDEIISRLNTHAPDGLTISGAWAFEGPGAAALVSVADYYLIVDSYMEQTDEIIQSLLSQESIVIPKKTKSGIKDTDIRQDILDISAKPPSLEGDFIQMRLSAGSARFINPLIVAGLILKQDANASSIIRTELYRHTKDNEGIISLYEASIH